jgi:hypothetical protein
VLNGNVPFDGAGLTTPDGFLLPGFLSALGPVVLDQLLARLDRSGDVDNPWFLATRITVTPSSTLTIGLNRAALFGGEGNEPVTLRRVLLMLVGVTDADAKDSDFENQVASFDFRWRPVRRLLVHAEYAADDAGAFIRVPAITVGASVAAVAHPALTMGAEVTGIARSTGTFPAWYRHGALADGWTDRGMLLAHPLGGNGIEAGLTWQVDPESSPMIASGRLYARDRGSENLFSPDRHGASAGAEFRLRLQTTSWLRVDGAADVEWGRSWNRWAARLAAAAAF